MMTRRHVLEITITYGAASVVAAACSSEDKTTGSSTSSSGSSSGGSSGGSSGTTKDASNDTGSADTAEAFQCRSSIAGNHGHSLVIPVADLESSSPKTYTLTGVLDHRHEVTFDALQLADLKAGISVTVTSTTGGQTHDHDVAAKCS